MQITLTELAGFKSAFKSMRNAHKSWDKSDSFKSPNNYYALVEYSNEPVWKHVGPNDIALAQKLIRAGDSHAKDMRGIMAWIEIEDGPDYFWDDLCTYSVGVTKLSSTSTMHDEFKNLEGEELQKARAAQPRGCLYTRTYVWSYQALRNMYHQRKHHRLPEFKQLCAFIETLPLAKELICL